MNSEVPPISESNNSKFESTKPAQKPLEELKVESTSDFDDAWLEDDIDDIVDVVDITVEPEDEFPKSDRSSANSTIVEPDVAEQNKATEFTITDVASEQETELIEQPLENTLEQKTELLEQPLENTLEQNIEDTKPLVKTEDSEIEQPLELSNEPELFVDSWLDELKSDPSPATPTQNILTTKDKEVNELEGQKAALQNEIEALKAQKEQMLLQQVREVRENMAQIVEEGTKELKERKARLQIEIEKLERRKDRINHEMRANFAGSSQELAVKVQGFKEYLVGSLQDLARAAEKLDLANEANPPRTSARGRSRDENMAKGNQNRDRSRSDRRDRLSRDTRDTRDTRGSRSSNRNSISSASQGQFTEPTFADQSRRIRQLIDKYLNSPNYYGSPWQLRRTFEQVHAKKVQDWFFVQGGRGAVDTMGSRLQNILIASAAISILHSLYGDRCRVLVLTDTPENLGEWRRGLQDCLGISRANFGSNRGVTLFDSPEVAVQRAERLIEDKLLPMIIIDETDELLNLSVLKFPLWLAFASSNKQSASNYLY